MSKKDNQQESQIVRSHVMLPDTFDSDIKESVDDIRLALLTLYSAGMNDIIYLYVSAWGGESYYMYKLLNAIKYAYNHCLELYVVADAPTASAAANLVLYSDTVIIHPVGVYFLLHKERGGFPSQIPHVKVKKEFEAGLARGRELDKLLQISSVLTPKELEEYNQGEDILVEGDSMIKRLKKLGKTVNKEYF